MTLSVSTNGINTIPCHSAFFPSLSIIAVSGYMSAIGLFLLIRWVISGGNKFLDFIGKTDSN